MIETMVKARSVGDYPCSVTIGMSGDRVFVASSGACLTVSQAKRVVRAINARLRIIEHRRLTTE